MDQTATPSQPACGAKSKEDHRTTFARRKRERTKAILLDSVMAVYVKRVNSIQLVIDDVIVHAGVSRGTFYKYFSSLDEAIVQISSKTSGEMVDSSLSVYDQFEDPLYRTGTGLQLYLARAFFDHEWGTFHAYMALQDTGNRLVQLMEGDIRQGIKTGIFSSADQTSALDLLIGTKIEAIKRICSGSVGSDYIVQITEAVFRGLGVPPQLAHEAARKCFDFVVAEGPEKLRWWGGTVRISVCGRAVDHQAAMALMKRSPKITANCAFAMVHSRGGI
ncbi:TetR/AcrR family transcriptional regulator, partial [Sphingomonas sp. HH69]